MTDNKLKNIGEILNYPLDSNFNEKNHLNGGDIIGGRLGYDGGLETALGMRDYYGGFSYAYIRYDGAGLESDKNAYPHTELRLYTNQKPNEPPHLVLAQYEDDPAQTSSASGVIVSPSFKTQDGRIVSIAINKNPPPRGDLYFVDEHNERHYLPTNIVGGAWIGNGQSAVQWMIQDTNHDVLIAPRNPSNPDAPPSWTRFYCSSTIDAKLNDLHLEHYIQTPLEGRILSIGMDKNPPPRGDLYFDVENGGRHYLPTNIVGGAWIGAGQSAVQWMIQDSNHDVLIAPRNPSNPDAPPSWTRFYSSSAIDQKFQQENDSLSKLDTKIDTLTSDAADTANRLKQQGSDIADLQNQIAALKKTVDSLASQTSLGSGNP